MKGIPAALASALLGWLADALAPPTCVACDTRRRPTVVFCPSCAATVVKAPGALGESTVDTPLAFALFGGAIAEALRRFKYDARPDLATPLGHLARRAARIAGLTGTMVVPVPLHPRRLAERGYNQAALLGTEVATELEAELATGVLERRRDTPQQARLDRPGRLANVVGAFSVRLPHRLRGARVVLVDDVATTGATLSACAGPLLEAGALSVTALVVARAPHRGEALAE